MADKDVKSLIINSATKFFSKFGFHKTTMDEIAKYIHKAKGVLYYYFKSKEELFNEVLKEELNTVKQELNKIANADTDYLSMVKEYFLTRLKLLSTAVNYHETLKADFFEKYHFVKDVREDFKLFEYQKLELIFTKGIDEGYVEISDIGMAVNIVLMIINSIELPLYLQDKYAEYENTFDEMISMLINSLRYMKK